MYILFSVSLHDIQLKYSFMFYQVEFERAKKDDEPIDESKKMVKRTLFGFLNPYPQKKVIFFAVCISSIIVHYVVPYCYNWHNVSLKLNIVKKILYLFLLSSGYDFQQTRERFHI